jgi:branched-subunit amino acid ABC-type transport system permease component
VPDLSFVFAQSLSGLTAAMFLFLIASGLSLIFGVLRVLNFAHGTFYMLGAYSAYQIVQWLGVGPGTFWMAALGAALGIALLGGIVERLLFPPPLRQGRAVSAPLHLRPRPRPQRRRQIIWGTQQKS